jgi:hypothetical protein
MFDDPTQHEPVPRGSCYLCGQFLWSWSRAYKLLLLVGWVRICAICAKAHPTAVPASWDEELLEQKDVRKWRKGGSKWSV